ncbi:hypothetical protein P3W45_000310 [Vairimorpha bombi]|jgi:hypothetical protein
MNTKLIELIKNSKKDKTKESFLMDDILNILVGNDIKTILEEVSKMFERNFSMSNFQNIELIKNIEIPEIISLKEEFCKLKPELIAFVVNLSFKKEKVLEHKLVIYLLNEELLIKYLPGIMSNNLKYLASQDTSHEMMCERISIINYLLSKDVYIDDKGKDILFNVLANTKHKYIVATSYLCKKYFDDGRLIYFLHALVLNNVELSIEEYEMINLNLEHQIEIIKNHPEKFKLVFDLVKILTKKNKLKLSLSLWNNLKYIYHQNYEFKDIIEIIQEKYSVDSPIWELMPVTVEALKKISAEPKFELEIFLDRIKEPKFELEIFLDRIKEPKFELEIFLDRIKEPKFELEILKLYLIHPELKPNIERKYDLGKISLENKETISNWLYFGLDTLFRRNMKSLCYKNTLISKKYIDPTDFDEGLDRLLEGCLVISRINKQIDLSLVTNLCLRFLYKLTKKEVALRIFQLVLFQQKSEIRKDNLIYLFNKTLYYDIDCTEIRIIKYELINSIIIKLCCGKDMEITPSKLNTKEYDFFLPLLVKLWEEVSVIPEEDELVSVMILLRTAITLSDKFYQRRFLSSNFFEFIIKRFKSQNYKKNDKDKYESFLLLLETVVDKFEFSGDVYENILIIVIDLYRIFYCLSLLKQVIFKDVYFAFYIVFIQKKVENSETIKVVAEVIKKTVKLEEGCL